MKVIIAEKIGYEGCLKVLQVVSQITGKKVSDIIDFCVIRMIRKYEKDVKKDRAKEEKRLRIKSENKTQPIIEDFVILEDKRNQFIELSSEIVNGKEEIVKEL